MIDNETLNRIKEVSLPVLLSGFGIQPTPLRNLESQYLTYIASYRGEQTPSLSVFRKGMQWLYRDHATGEYGTNIDLLVRFGYFSNWREAAAYVANKYLGVQVDSLAPATPRMDFRPTHPERQVTQPLFYGIINEFYPIVDSPAEKYIVNTRRVPISVASQFVCFARYSYSPGSKVFSGIAWPTVRGGWSIRWAIDLGPGKGKAFVGPGGFSFFPVVPESRSETCTLFEGMFDALSFVTLHGRCGDIIVLNSVDNVNEALNLLSSYHGIYGYLDADVPGRNGWKAVVDRCGAKAIDTSDEFAGFKDYNDYIKALIINK